MAYAAKHVQGLVERRKALVERARAEAVRPRQRVKRQARRAGDRSDPLVEPVPARTRALELRREVECHALVQGVFEAWGEGHVEIGIQRNAVVSGNQSRISNGDLVGRSDAGREHTGHCAKRKHRAAQASGDSPDRNPLARARRRIGEQDLFVPDQRNDLAEVSARSGPRLPSPRERSPETVRRAFFPAGRKRSRRALHRAATGPRRIPGWRRAPRPTAARETSPPLRHSPRRTPNR